MTATYTFDVFTSLDGFGTAGGEWSGYWAGRACSPTAPRNAGWPTPWVTKMWRLPAMVVSDTLHGSLDWPGRDIVPGDAVDVVARMKQESRTPTRSYGIRRDRRGAYTALTAGYAVAP